MLGAVQNCHHCPKRTQSMLEGGGERFNGLHMLFKNDDYDALHFHTGSLKINIFKVFFLEGGREGVTKKSTLCSLLIMLTILDDLLAASVTFSSPCPRMFSMYRFTRIILFMVV